MKFTGKNGVLRIFDGSKILHGAAPRDDATIDVVKFNGVDTWANITADVEADDALAATAFLADNDDVVYIGSTKPFAIVKYLRGDGTNYGAGTGALKAFYFDGTDFSTALGGIADGTASGGDCFAQDGNISFKAPSAWITGANAYNANLDSDKYYIALQTTTSATTTPDADVLCPVDGQYFEVSFSAMDFSGPLGRPKTEEQLVLDRGNMNSKAHYIEGMDHAIYESIAISFSALLDDVHNRERLQDALICGNPNDGARWTSTGTTTKGQTKNDGSNYNPAFADSSKKTVNIQWLMESTSGLDQGMAFYETYFPPDEITISEAEDGVTLSAAGGCFGVVERTHHLCNRY